MKNTLKIIIFGLICIISQACETKFYSNNDFSKVKKIDAHFHYYSGDSSISLQALNDNFYLLDINYDLSENINGNDTAVLLMEKNSIKQKKTFPNQFDYLCAFTLSGWDKPDWTRKTISRLNKSFANGAIGVKLWKNIGMAYRDIDGKFIMIDNPRFDSIIQFIVDQDKAILGHFGEPKNCWLPMDQITTKGDAEYFSHNPLFYMYLHPDFPSYEQQMAARDKVVKKFPKLRFIGAHLSSMEWSVDELAKTLDANPNMAVDVSSRLAHLQLQSISNYEKVRNFILKYQDRLLYGSDEGFESTENSVDFNKRLHNIWLEQWRYFVTDEIMSSNQIEGEFIGLKLPKKVIDKIYRINAEKWYKITIEKEKE